MLKHQLQDDTKNALKSGDSFSLGVLRMALSAVNLKEKDKKYKNPDTKDLELTDAEVIDVISSEIKKRKDAIALYQQGGRPELADNEKKEMAVLQKYLPEQLSQDELKKLIEVSIKKVGAKEMKDMGKVMADLAPSVKGKADNSEISKLIKEILNG